MAETIIAPSAGPSGSGSGDVVGPAASTDGEVALYSGITGKLLKRSNTFNGIGRVTAGVFSAADLSGDVTTSGSNVVTIANDAVTFAKMQNVNASRIIGRGSLAGAGDAEELTLGAGLAFSGTVINASGGSSVTVRKNTGADVGTRPRLNLIEGSNVTLTVADDAGSNEVDITIAAAGGSSSDVVVALASDVVHTTNSTTLENITGMTFPITSSPTEIWKVEVLLLTNQNAAAANTAKWKFGWTFPGGVTGFWASQVEREVPPGNAQPLAPSIAVTISFGGSGTFAQGMIAFQALIAGNGNAGAVQLQFAQNGTIAGAINTIKRTSTFIARKVAN